MFPTIIKHRKKPHELLAYEALFRRILEHYRQHEAIVSEYKRVKAGYDGERNVDYKLSTYPQKNFFVFQGIRLQNPPFPFQIDTLILTEKMIYILEVKNQKGVFQYDSEQQQLTQIVDGEVKSYKDPILQAEAQKTHLQGWLARHGVFNMPIETLVVIAYPSTVIENITKDPEVYKKIIHNESLHEHLNRLNNRYTENILTSAHLKKLCQALLNEDTPLRTDILQQHNIGWQHMIKGIPCEKCYQYPMERLNKKWQCPKCSAVSSKAHERVILDHLLLHSTTITNRQCREILQVDSPGTAYLLMKSMNLSRSGKNSARVYYSPLVNEFPQSSNIPIKFKNNFAKQSLD
ncbi:nuclease-related domain-containing protein [Lentibacillus salicampi]|uniref:NERD domain-containing protein n=1 Tax=Lentibacillus salicampi TaxID=175306 RepID=A0A4Y9A8R7_9BACI|nr:nuclease-related domain-containing protein [Lentibacillus salicampi]TFJ92236.1 NERD domain-containing protein [Lentibacillus salicampi]